MWGRGRYRVGVGLLIQCHPVNRPEIVLENFGLLSVMANIQFLLITQYNVNFTYM